MGWAQDEQSNFLIYSKIFKRLELIRSKEILPMLQKFQIQYGFEYFEIRNNYPYCNFSKFRIEFELKIKEALEFEIQ
jgi:hypothetical protein